MKVICPGFGRTGTTSLKAALERLGFGPCYKMFELIRHPDHASQWLAACRGTPIDWTALLAGYESTVDWPGCTFWRELVDAFPEAKVVLNTRDPERWYASVRDTFVYAMERTRAAAGGQGQAETVIPEPIRQVVQATVFDTFAGRLADKDFAIGVFERHNAAVRAAVPPARLLEYAVGDGWSPLCDFLRVPVPDEPFPRLNGAASFRQRSEVRNGQWITEQPTTPSAGGRSVR